MNSKAAVKINGVTEQIDPQLFFQQLTIAAEEVDMTEDILKYKLCSYPLALFDPSLLLRQPQKSALAKAIWDSMTEDIPGISRAVQFVLDGGSLLQ